MSGVDQAVAGAAGVASARAEIGSGALNLAQRFDRLPLSRYHRKVFLIIATAWLFDSVDLAALTFVLAPISDAFDLSDAQAGALGSASFAGMLVGASAAGMLADRIGRRRVFQYSMILWGAASLAMGLAWDFASLVAFRFIIGCGMGAEYPVAMSLVSEFMPSRQRGRYIGFLEGFWPLGFILSGLISVAFVSTISWRVMFFILAGMACYALIIRRAVPESPRWYASQGRYEEADQTMRAFEHDVERSTGAPLAAPAPADPTLVEAVTRRMSVGELFTSEYRGRTVMMWVVWFFALLGYYGITTWMAKLLADNGLSITKSISFVLLMTLWGVPGFLVASYLLDRLGRRPVVSGFIILSAVAAFAYGQAHSTAALIVAGSFMQFFFFGMWSALYAYTPEVFPTRARATGCGTSSGAGRLGALIGPLFIPALLATSGGKGLALGVAAVSFLVAAGVILLFGPETKQKVLEEVSA